MIYQSTSIEGVISRILRNTKLTDSSAINDMYEWIPEAMEMMQTKYEMEAKYEDIDICFHKGKLPCGLKIIKAIEYCGMRLNFSSGAMTPQSVPSTTTVRDQQMFHSIRGEQLNPETGDNIPFLGEQIEAIMQLPISGNDYYQVSMGTITTSFPEGKVRVHYYGVPLDDKGFPLIPDNSNYKQALYWYVRSMLIGAGMYTDSVFSERECMQRFELYAGRAINEITWPSEDRMQEMVNSQVRLIKPVNYWGGYGAVPQEGPYGY